MQQRHKEELITGLYFRALEKGIAGLPKADSAVRQALLEELDAWGPSVLHRRLRRVDPVSAGSIHPNDTQRLVRALEVQALTGNPISRTWRSAGATALPYPVVKLVVAPSERGLLHQRIAERFSMMLDRGLVNEVQHLKWRGVLSAIKAVGYKAVGGYLEGKYSREEMLDRGIIATRQLAKRQLTWLKREESCIWVDSGASGIGKNVLALLWRHPVFKELRYSLE